MEFQEITHYVVEVSRWRIIATAHSEEDACAKRDKLQESIDEWNYDHPHLASKALFVMSVSEFYHGY